jgi:hypothetical protein
VGEHLREVGELAVGAEGERALDETDGEMRVLDAEARDNGDGGVRERVDAEEELEGAGVVLGAVAGERGVQMFVDAFEGLEDGDGGRDLGAGWWSKAGGALELARGEERDGAVDEAANGEERREEFGGESEGVHSSSVVRK